MVIFVELKPVSGSYSSESAHWLGFARNLKPIHLVRDICMAWREKLGAASKAQLCQLFLDGEQFHQLREHLTHFQREDDMECDAVATLLAERVKLVEEPDVRVQCLRALFDLQTTPANKLATSALMLSASVTCKTQTKTDLYLHIADALASSYPEKARWILEALLQSSLKVGAVAKALHVFRKLGDLQRVEQIASIVVLELF